MKNTFSSEASSFSSSTPKHEPNKPNKPNNETDARAKLTFGDFIRWAYDVYGKRKAKGIVTLAISARLLEFRGPQRIEISAQE